MGTLAANPLDQPVPSPVSTPAPTSPLAPGVGFVQRAVAPVAAGSPAALDTTIPAGIQQPMAQQVMADAARYPISKGMAGSGTESASSTKSVGGATMTPEQRARENAAYDASLNVAAKQEQAGASGAESLINAGLIADQRINELAKENEKQAKIQADWQTKQEKMNADIQAKQDQYVQEAKNLDPNRIMSGGNRVLAAISMIGGRVAEAFGAKNNSLQLINDAISRDYQLQKDHLAGSKEGVTLSRQSLNDARSMFQDENAAALQHKSNMLEVIASMQIAQGLKDGSREAIDKSAVDAAKTQADAAEKRAQAFRIEGTRTFSNSDQYGKSSTGGQAPTEAEILDLALKKIELGKAADAGAPGAVDVEEAKVFRSRLSGAKDLQRLSKELEGLLKQGTVTTAGGGVPLLDSSNRIKVQAVKDRMAVALARANNASGQISDQDMATAKEQVGSGVWTVDQAEASAKDLARNAAAGMFGQFSGLHGRLQKAEIERIRGAGYDPEFLQLVTTGEATPTGDKAPVPTGTSAVPTTDTTPIRSTPARRDKFGQVSR